MSFAMPRQARFAGIVGPSWQPADVGRRADTDRAALETLLTEQHRVISRSQALAADMSEAALRHRIREGGPWRVLLPGVYLATTGTSTPSQRCVAALLYAGPGSMLTSLAALRYHGVRIPTAENIDVLIPAQRRRNNTGFARVHRTKRMPRPVLIAGTVRYAPTARAVADAARLLPTLRDARAVVADVVQQGKCEPSGLVRELESGPVQGSRRLRLALAEIADGIRSVTEADLRDLIKRAHLPEPLFNPGLYAGGTFIASPDCWWPIGGIAAEVDSREWHISPEDWERTMARQARMSSYGIIVLHFTPWQIRTGPATVVRLIRDALAAAADRKLPITAVPAR
jgi:hypothetical protein